MHLNQFRGAVRVLKQHEEFMSAHLMDIFLTIASRDECNPQDLRHETGAAKSSMSRHLAHLGPYSQRGKPGLGWISVEEDLNDRRSKVIRLTEEGQRIVNRIKDL